ncbi:hypothetical protein [Haloarchaeobius sp. DFWS5]
MQAIDVVDAGADPNGRTKIDDVVRSQAGRDTRLVFAPGTYLVGALGE